MKILNTDITQYTFEDIQEFCKKNIPEGVELDYKREVPQKGLAKYFAAFSNTRGGLIIIGIEEDKKTGLPMACIGVNDEAKEIERLYQNASNVTPIPNFIIHKTKSKEGKVFILVRIFEGENPPYYIQNRADVWIRTGNITKPIDITSPAHLELLFDKRERAQLTRDIYMRRSKKVYEGALKLAEKERQHSINEAKRKGDGSEKHYFQNQLGSKTLLCESYVMPFSPLPSLADLPEIKSQLLELRGNNTFPALNMTSMPDGLYNFESFKNGMLSGQQIYSNGFISALIDALSVENNKKILKMHAVAWNAYHVLRTAKKMYEMYGYQGVVYYKTSLSKVNHVSIEPLTAGQRFFYDEIQESLLNNYEWTRTFSTLDLATKESFSSLYKDILKEMNWSFGFGELNMNIADGFISENNMYGI